MAKLVLSDLYIKKNYMVDRDIYFIHLLVIMIYFDLIREVKLILKYEN